MNILLIQPQYNRGMPYAEAPSQALLILGTLAQNAGHKVKVLHLDIEETPLPYYLIDLKPDIVGMTVNTFQVKSAKHITNLIRGVSPESKIIIGGPHASAWNEDADGVVIGEGENKWLHFITDGKNVIETLDNLPMLDYNLINLDDFCGIHPVGATPSVCMMASRGCPFNCTFCNTPLFWGKKVRCQTPHHIVGEVERLHKIWGVKEVFFQDDTFNLNHKWAFEIFEGLIKKGLNKKILFKICCRVNEKLLTREFLDLAFRAGVWNIFYGVESGSQKMLDRMKKGITVDEVKRAFEMTHEAHIATQASFIVGMPGETFATLGETDRLIHEIKPTRYGWTYACPFPDTELDKEVTAKGHKRKMDYGDYGYGLVMARTDALDFKDLESFEGFTY